MAVTHKAEGVALGPDLIFAQAETTQDEVALIQRWVAYQVEMMIASSQRLRTLPLCTDFEGRLSRSGHEVGQLHILLDGMLSMQPLPRINLHIQGPRGLVTSGLVASHWLASSPACLRSREKDPAGSFCCAYRCPWMPTMRSRI